MSRRNTSVALQHLVWGGDDSLTSPGRAVDLSVYGKPGVPTNAPALRQTPWGPAWFLTAASSQYVDLGATKQLDLLGSMSIIIPIVIFTDAGPSQQLLSKDSDSGGRAFTFDYNTDGADAIRFYINGGGPGNEVTYAITPTAGVRYWLGATYHVTGVARLYLNGTMVAEATGLDTSIPTATTSARLGIRSYPGFTEPFGGYLAVRSMVFNAALTPGQMLKFYTTPDWIFQTPRRFYFAEVAAGGDPEGRLIGGKLLRGGLLRSGVLH